MLFIIYLVAVTGKVTESRHNGNANGTYSPQAMLHPEIYGTTIQYDFSSYFSIVLAFFCLSF